MNAQKKIEELRGEIDSLKNVQRTCKHEWKEAEYDPEKIMVSDDRSGYEIHGSDIWARSSYHEEYKQRWSRECATCGVTEYTYQQEVVNITKKPKFK